MKKRIAIVVITGVAIIILAVIYSIIAIMHGETIFRGILFGIAFSLITVILYKGRILVIWSIKEFIKHGD